MAHTKRQEKRIKALKRNKRVKNPFALEVYLEKHERAKRIKRRKRTRR